MENDRNAIQETYKLKLLAEMIDIYNIPSELEGHWTRRRVVNRGTPYAG